jgi:aminoglycoside phosphotransferase (APT) family kinase protein
VLAALTDLNALMTPSPWPAAPHTVEHLTGLFTAWEDLDGADRDRLDPWSRRHLDALVRQGRLAVASLAGGQTLCHVDVRSDNILLTDDRVVFVDWNWTAVGPSWFDAALLLLEVRSAGGPDPDKVAATHPLLRDVDPATITAFVAAVTGMFVRNSRRPAPPGLPTLRAFQAAYAEALLAWTKQRTGWQ